MDTNKGNDKLNEVVECLHDSCDGYKEALSTVNDIKLKNLFQLLSAQRREMLDELKTYSDAYNKETTDTGSMVGAMHRVFIDLKSLVTGGKSEAIVAEVKRGENYTINRYQDALKEELPLDIKSILSRQLDQIRSNMTNIDMLVNTNI